MANCFFFFQSEENGGFWAIYVKFTAHNSADANEFTICAIHRWFGLLSDRQPCQTHMHTEIKEFNTEKEQKKNHHY